MEKNFRVSRIMNEDMRARSTELQSIGTIPKWLKTENATGPLALKKRAGRKNSSTTRGRFPVLIAQVGEYTPKRVLCSLVKNQRDTADMNNMRQKIPISYKVLLIAITAS
jgi:hypothetical protein